MTEVSWPLNARSHRGTHAHFIVGPSELGNEPLKLALDHLRIASQHKQLRTIIARLVVGCDERLDPSDGAQLRLAGPPARIYPTRWIIVQQALDQLWLVYLQPLISMLQLLLVKLSDGDEVIWRTLLAVQESLAEQGRLLQTILQARRSDLVTWIDCSVPNYPAQDRKQIYD